jgi:hypothetical protein
LTWCIAILNLKCDEYVITNIVNYLTLIVIRFKRIKEFIMPSQPHRFSNYQNILCKCMISLINLHYFRKCSQEKLGEITRTVVYEKIALLLGEVFKSSCSYDKRRKKFLVTNLDSKGAMTVRLIDICDNDIRRFMITMELLRKEILAERYVHFATYGVDDNVSSYVSINESANTNRNILIEGHRNDDEEVLYKASKKELETTVELITRNLFKLTDESISYAEAEDRNREIRIASIRTRIYKVVVLSIFGKRVSGAKHLLKELKHEITEVHQLESGYISSFHLFIRALLILFHIHFDGYHRLKICKYSDCKRMFFEKKKGNKEFCSGTCRKKHLDLGEDERIRKCRARQNAWLVRSKESRGDSTVNRSHCEVCLAPMPTSKCSKLLELNAEYLL